MRGAPILIWLLVILAWVGIRIGYNYTSQNEIARGGNIGQAAKRAPPKLDKIQFSNVADQSAISSQKQIGPIAVYAQNHVPGKMPPPFFTDKKIASTISHDRPKPKSNIIAGKQSGISVFHTSLSRQNPSPKTADRQINSEPRTFNIAPVTTSHKPVPRRKKLSVYGYSFWRNGRDSNNVASAAAAQYGGSQSGIIANYRLTGKHKAGLYALARMAVSSSRFSDPEIAAGLRWRPSQNIPISFSAEHRTRQYAKDQYAIYASGGKDEIPLRLGFHASMFGQAGFIPSNKTGGFFDAQIHATRPIGKIHGVTFASGIGAWAGGQRRSDRVDIGPSVNSKFKLGGTDIQMSADWRHKIAGNAAPGSGPALTISTGF